MPIKEFLTKIRDRFKKTPPVPSIPEGEAPASLPPKKGINKKVFFLLAGLIIILLSLSLVFALIRNQTGKEEMAAPLPSPSPTEEELIIPSNYATDSAVLDLEDKLKEIETDILGTDLSEAGLNPPLIDLEVEFKENDS